MRLFAIALERAAEVPARGFEVASTEEVVEVIGTLGGRVLKRKPVLRPITELRGL